MKSIIFAGLMLSTLIVVGQKAKKDSLAAAVDTYITRVYQAATQFLNRQLSAAERVKAIQPYPIIYDEKQIQEFKNVVLNNDEQPEVRAMALNKIYSSVPGDERLSRLTIEWLTNPQIPKVQRSEALQFARNASYSSMTVPAEYQKLLDDPELEFRVFGYRTLIIHGDPRATQRLIAGLDSPAIAPMPGATAIELLSMAPKKEFYPSLYRILQSGRDEATTLEAIRALGDYPQAEQRLIAITRDPTQKEEFREAALGALYAADRENIVTYAMPILNDKSSPERLQGVAIQMSIDVRQAMSYRVKAKKADDYDNLIKSIAEDQSRSADVRQIATKYLQSVRPRF